MQLLNRLGRRLLSVLMFVICGVACLLCALIPNDEPGTTSATIRIVAAIVGKFGVSSAVALLYVYTSELFPSAVRSAALGVNSSVARIGGIAATMVALLAEVVHAGWLGLVIFGIMSTFAGTLFIAAYSLPSFGTICAAALLRSLQFSLCLFMEWL
jgi:MFS transporter, OCT family, solute carrier family 22 (organic cation transporter), member 4/5